MFHRNDCSGGLPNVPGHKIAGFWLYGIEIPLKEIYFNGMTKQQLIDTIAQSENISKQVVKTIIDAVFDCIVEALAAGDKVELRGFGSFRAKRRDGRTARNPKNRWNTFLAKGNNGATENTT